MDRKDVEAVEKVCSELLIGHHLYPAPIRRGDDPTSTATLDLRHAENAVFL